MIERIAFPTANPPKCDFCSGTDPGPVHCFVVTEPVILEFHDGEKKVTMDDDNHWGACPTCAAFIEAGDHEGLFERSLQTYKERFPDQLGPETVVSLGIVQESLFWSGFKGVKHPGSEHGPDGKLSI